jgi:DNA processing protein
MADLTPIPLAWIALCLVDHLGVKKLRALWTHFNGDLDAILKADERDLDRVPGIGVKLAAAIKRIDMGAVERALTRWERAGVTLIPLRDPRYPPLLRRIPDPPPLLFLRGDLPHGRSAAIVGTRQPKPETLLTAKRIGCELAKRGWIIVSGLALGIDTGGHMGALAGGGQTVAVLGSGVLVPYPSENRLLVESVTGLISETQPDAHPSAPLLVARNRIISGMCSAVIVVETSAEGGAMHAARRAFEQGRRVFTLDNAATGNQALAAGGAALFPNADGLIAAVDALDDSAAEGTAPLDFADYIQPPLL